MAGQQNKGIIRFIPNTLTLGRFFLTIIFLVMILYSPKVKHTAFFLDIAFVFFIITALTDIVDGYLARKFDVTSKFGRMMDPLADKVLVCGAYVCFAIISKPTLFNITGLNLKIILWAIAIIIIARELFVTILRHIAEAKGINFAATASGKLKMFLQSFGIGTIIIKTAHVQRAWGDWITATVFILMIASTIISGFSSVRRGKAKI